MIMRRIALPATLLLTAIAISCAPADNTDTAVAPAPRAAEAAAETAPAVTESQVASETRSPEPVAAAEPEGVSLATVDDIAEFMNANRGKVLVMNFWATWCAPCVHEMPELASFYSAYRDRGVAFLSLSSDKAEDYETKVVPFVTEHSLPFHVYAIGKTDPDELDKVLQLGMDFALPTTFVFDRDGNQVKKWMRNITQTDLERVVDPLLEPASEK